MKTNTLFIFFQIENRLPHSDFLFFSSLLKWTLHVYLQIRSPYCGNSAYTCAWISSMHKSKNLSRNYHFASENDFFSLPNQANIFDITYIVYIQFIRNYPIDFIKLQISTRRETHKVEAGSYLSNEVSNFSCWRYIYISITYICIFLQLKQ